MTRIVEADLRHDLLDRQRGVLDQFPRAIESRLAQVAGRRAADLREEQMLDVRAGKIYTALEIADSERTFDFLQHVVNDPSHPPVHARYLYQRACRLCLTPSSIVQNSTNARLSAPLHHASVRHLRMDRLRGRGGGSGNR